MKPRLVVAAFLIAVAVATATASAADVLPRNTWVDLVADDQKSTLTGNSFQGSDYFAWIPVVVAPGGKYTLLAEWDDGKAMLILVRGYDPAGKSPSPPSGTYNQVALNTSGGKAWRINFTIDPKSAGETAWMVFMASAPGRALRIMIKSPGDPDEVTAAVVKGSCVGSVFRTPLHLFAR